MNIYLLSHDKEEQLWPEFYTESIVAAESEEDARRIFPDESFIEAALENIEKNPNMSQEEAEKVIWENDVWVDPADVRVKLIGRALDGATVGVVSSYYVSHPYDANPFDGVVVFDKDKLMEAMQ